MLKEFEKYLNELSVSENTISSYVSDLKIFIAYYEDTYGEKLTKLIKSDIMTYISFLKNRENRKPTTINRKLSALKKYNEFLVQKHIQDNVVIGKKDFIKIETSFVKDDVPDEKEIDKLKHEAAENKRDFCVICLATYGGLRESEIVHIKITHIHLEKRFIEIYGKGNKYRTIIINDILYNAIKYYLEDRIKINKDNEYLLVGKKSSFYINKPLNRNFVNRILKKYNVNVKIKDLHPHLLRHFFCTTAYYKAGYSMFQVAAQAGHSSISTTRKYIDNHNKDMLKLANSL